MGLGNCRVWMPAGAQMLSRKLMGNNPPWKRAQGKMSVLCLWKPGCYTVSQYVIWRLNSSKAGATLCEISITPDLWPLDSPPRGRQSGCILRPVWPPRFCFGIGGWLEKSKTGEIHFESFLSIQKVEIKVENNPLARNPGINWIKFQFWLWKTQEVTTSGCC